MEFSDVECLNLCDLRELAPEEKENIKGTIDEICAEAEQLEAKALHIDNKLSKETLLNHAKRNRKTALTLKQKITISEGKQCFCPSDIKLALRNSTLTANSEEQLERRLKNNCNYYSLQFDGVTPGNGNCFFEAMSHQMERLQLPPTSPQALRSDVTKFIQTNHFFEDIDGQVSLKDFVETNFDDYLINMSMDGVYADHIIVLGTARMLEMDICIVTSSPDAVPENSLIWIVGKPNFQGNPFLLGHYWENHYQSLKTKGQPVEDDSPKINTQKEVHLVENKGTSSNVFVDWVKETFCKRWSDTETIVKEIAFDSCEEDIIFTFQQTAEENNEGVFIHEHKNKKTVQYFCERHCKAKGKKKSAEETRANNCPAYISFRFINQNGKKAVINRKNTNHMNHDLTNLKEKKVNRINPQLVSYIEVLAEQGKKPIYIIVKCVKWSRDRGHFDVHDRKYYPTPTDVRNIIYSFKSRKRLHQNDAVAVECLCTDVLKSSIIYYQRQSDNNQPLIIVYQNDEQKKRMDLFSKNVVFLDATYKGVTGYGYAFYCMLVRDDKGKGTPIAYMITSEDCSHTISIFLQKLKESASNRGCCFLPRSFMIDKDMKEVSSIKENFPMAQILLCWFHVLQAIYRWLNKKDSGVSGNQHTETRRNIVQYLRQMKNCSTKDDFDRLADNLDTQMPNLLITKYLKENWVTVGEMWSSYGRKFYHEDQDTNNLAERFFLGLKYHFLGGYGNIRIEDLLLLIHENITTFYNYLDELARTGRLKNTRQVKEAKGKGRAEEMLKSGYGKMVVWSSEWKCTIPSETTPHQIYNVDIVKVTCGCLSSTQGGLCKHLNLALLIAEQREVDLTRVKEEIVKNIIESNNYICDGNNIEIYFDGDVSCVNMTLFNCTCIANSHNIACVCLNAAQILQGEGNEVENVSNIPEMHEPCTRTNIRSKIDEIVTWMNGDGLLNTTNLENISNTVNKLHSEIFCTKFRKVSKKRKIQPIRVFEQKKNDHSYHSRSTGKRLKPNSDTLNEDGSFKATSRKKGSVRKPFL